MKFFTSIIIPAVLLLLMACQPGALTKKETIAGPDSSLYFQQVDVDDPFLDTIFQLPQQEVTLNRLIIPPPPPEPPAPKFKEIEGYRVQVFAGLDSLKAGEVANQVSGFSPDSVHLLVESGLHKVQIGDFPYRAPADNLKLLMRRNGFPGAWVVQRTIVIPVAADSSDSSATRHELPGNRYQIQVAAVQDKAHAERLKREVSQKTDQPVNIQSSGNLFKIVIGPLRKETEARRLLQQIRKQGYTDAWLVY